MIQSVGHDVGKAEREIAPGGVESIDRRRGRRQCERGAGLAAFQPFGCGIFGCRPSDREGVRRERPCVGPGKVARVQRDLAGQSDGRNRGRRGVDPGRDSIRDRRTNVPRVERNLHSLAKLSRRNS